MEAVPKGLALLPTCQRPKCWQSWNALRQSQNQTNLPKGWQILVKKVWSTCTSSVLFDLIRQQQWSPSTLQYLEVPSIWRSSLSIYIINKVDVQIPRLSEWQPNQIKSNQLGQLHGANAKSGLQLCNINIAYWLGLHPSGWFFCTSSP